MTQTCTEPTPSLPAANAGLAIVVLSRGAAYAGGLTELSDLATQQARLAAAQTPVLRVQPAFVDRAQPALPEALDLCADADQILILPVMVPDEPSLRRWLHKLIMRWRAKQQAGGPTGKHVPRIVLLNPCCSCRRWPSCWPPPFPARCSSPMCRNCWPMKTGSATPKPGPKCRSTSTMCCGAWDRAARPRELSRCGRNWHAPCSKTRCSKAGDAAANQLPVPVQPRPADDRLPRRRLVRPHECRQSGVHAHRPCA